MGEKFDSYDAETQAAVHWLAGNNLKEQLRENSEEGIPVMTLEQQRDYLENACETIDPEGAKQAHAVHLAQEQGHGSQGGRGLG